ncbi:hypothetical protein ES707_15068 [subsurface metagenome]
MLTAHPHAATAKHALIGVVDEDRTTGINRQISFKFLKPVCFQFNTQISGNFLQLTGAVTGTVSTVHRMSSHKQLEASAHQLQRLRTSGIHHHTPGYSLGTGSNRLAIALYLNKAQTASRRWLQSIPEGTQIWNIDTTIQGYPQEVLSFPGSYFLAVNG